MEGIEGGPRCFTRTTLIKDQQVHIKIIDIQIIDIKITPKITPRMRQNEWPSNSLCDREYEETHSLQRLYESERERLLKEEGIGKAPAAHT